MRVVLDTDVVIAGLISPTGASRRLLELAFEDRLTLLASVALFLEYESVAFRPDILALAALNKGEMTNLFTDLASAIEPVEIHFLWRPTLADAADEMVLEAAVNGQADILATFNARHFAPAHNRFNELKIAVPREVLREIERRQRR
ncbi:putative toxin-antitoxin system toxin component, PIN family [Reyranella sp.]|uniref:putative toxin-antitoxin system toxin component, PIN family n=1 Tax=Reyranella sp. TaxID=1929291 RepID=UPI003D125CFC